MQSADPFLFQLFLIFVWAKLFGEVFERLRLPAVLGEILAGVVIGPYGAQLVIPGDSIYAIAGIGAIFLLFTVGLETQPKDLVAVGRFSLYVALAGITVPFICGFGYMLAARHQAQEAIFVAVAMVATSVGITARVLGDMGLLQTRPARIILGAAVFDDILGMILLGIVVGLVSTTGNAWLQLLVTAVEAAAFALVMLLYAPRVVRQHGTRIGTHVHAQRAAGHRSRHLPGPLLRRGKDRDGGNYRRLLCRTGLCRVLSAMESPPPRVCHQ